MGLVALVHGFRLSVAQFDHSLQTNGLNPIGGYRPFPNEAAEIAQLFRSKGVDCEVRVFVPYITGFDRSQHLFFCYNWIYVLAAAEIDGELQKPVPPTFEDIRTSLWPESRISKYIVCNNEDETSWIPDELVQRHTAPIQCGLCDATFSLWRDRMRHREEEHGIDEDQNPLPNC